jgi:hypothetical protein
VRQPATATSSCACGWLDSAEARARGVHEHLAEVQLHLGAIVALTCRAAATPTSPEAEHDW